MESAGGTEEAAPPTALETSPVDEIAQSTGTEERVSVEQRFGEEAVRRAVQEGAQLPLVRACQLDEETQLERLQQLLAAIEAHPDKPVRLAELREHHDAFEAHKFLRVRKFDVVSAAERYCTMVRWRQEWGFDQSPDAPLVGTDAPDGRGITVTKLPLRQHSEPALSQTEQRMRNVASAASLDDDEVKDIQQAVDSLTLARSISEVDLDSEDVRNRIRAVYPLGYCNTDVHGRPVKVLQMGRFKCAIAQEQGFDVDTLLRWHVLKHEIAMKRYCVRQSNSGSARIENLTAVVDLSGFSFGSFGTQEAKCFSRLVGLIEPNYPESLKRLFVVNAPTIFTAAWAVIQMFLEKRTLDKITIHGSDYQSTLLEFISPDQLPVFLGGQFDWHPARDEDVGPYVQ